MEGVREGQTPARSLPAHLKHESSTLSASSDMTDGLLVSDPTLSNFDTPTLENQFMSNPYMSNFNPDGLSDPGDQFFADFTPNSNSTSPHTASDEVQFQNMQMHVRNQLGQDMNMIGSQSDLLASDYNTNASFDPSLLVSPNHQPNNDGAMSLEAIVAMRHQGQSHSPANVLRSNSNFSSHSPSLSPHHSPSPAHSPQAGMQNRPRATSQTLDPFSAAYPSGFQQGTWNVGPAFQEHRRQPSDALSEYSSHSNQASPYLGHIDTCDLQGHLSPLTGAQADNPLFVDNLGLNQFSISDTAIGPLDAFGTNGSMHNSPLMSANAQQPLPPFTSADDFGMSTDFQDLHQRNNDFANSMNSMAFPNLDTYTGSTEGQADTMSPPEIKFDLAPPSRVPSFGPRARAGSSNELAPPDAARQRRHRAKSDPFHGPRSPSPGLSARGRSPSLQPQNSFDSDSLSPAAVGLPSSRSPSPATSRNRSTSAASESRKALLELADPDRRNAGVGGDNKRQKNPATYQCTLCPKRFTRAYNLRSHLRTHTNERPFVCSVCNKAFARQHDRKRHEGLHSGEKKFVCRGPLQSGTQWGCGRKFARADALGRHFRSEAGRECIKPLLEEEREDRQRAWMEEQQQQQRLQLQTGQGMMAPQGQRPLFDQPALMTQLPAVLLQMYPDLANIDLGGLSASSVSGMEDDFTGRSSFDASSGADFDFTDNDEEDEFDDMHWQQQQQQQPQGQQQQQQF